MAIPPPTFNWFLWPSHGDLFCASDEFVVEGFRVRLMGDSLELVFEGSGACSPGSARALAERYTEVLRRRLPGAFVLITAEEFAARTTPPFGGMITARSPRRDDRSRVARAVREVRNELLASAHQALRRCYDYLQSARERGDDAIFDLYKAVETIENALGGEEKAGRILAVLKEIKALKRAANEPTRDERHAPKDPASMPPPANLGQAWENTLAVVRAYERYLLRPPG